MSAPGLAASGAASQAPDSEGGLSTLDLFAGAGGLTEGFKRAGGYRVVKAVELDPSAAATFRQNHGDVVHAGGIEEWVDAGDVPEVDVVLGGPPCQGFSLLGRRDENDERNTLWRQYARTLLIAQPRYFVLENVAAFLKTAEFAGLQGATARGGFLSDYALEFGVLNAAEHGAAQTRRRAIVIGCRRDIVHPGLPEPSSAPQRTVRDAFDGVAANPTEVLLPPRHVDVDGLRFPGPFRSDQLHLTRQYRSTTLARIRHIPEGGNRGDIPERLLPPCWKKHKTGSMDVMGRLRWDRPSVTIRTEFFKPEKGRYLHPVEHRAITPFEAARLQGFPDDYLWCGTKLSIARQIGNAVPIELAQSIGAHLRREHSSRLAA